MSRRHPADLIKSIDGDMFTVPRRTARPQQQRASGVYTHMAWASGGFVLGAIFWHMVGFWSFIDRMLDEVGPREQSVTVARAAPAPQPVGTSALTFVSELAAGGCIREAVVEASGETGIRPCFRPVTPLRNEPDAVVAGLTTAQ